MESEQIRGTHQRNFVSVENDVILRDPGAAVVQVTGVGLTLGVDGGRRVG